MAFNGSRYYSWKKQGKDGNLNSYLIEDKFGRNSAVPNGSWAPIVLTGSLFFPTTATTLRIKAGGNAADTAAGAGARSVQFTGLDATGNIVTETVATAGASASAATSQTFSRYFRSQVVTTGTYATTSAGTNTGIITIEVGAGGQDIGIIAAGEGQSQYGAFTVPLGYTGYLKNLLVTVDGAKAADIRVFARPNYLTTSAPYSSKNIKLFFDGVLGEVVIDPDEPILELASLTDLWVEARGGGGAATEVSVNFQIELMK